MLWGFCFNTQQKQRFNQSWACAFHTSWYTDELHPMWDSVDEPGKRREIRYGNNIYVLFRVLLHCKEFYDQGGFWAAISQGFNTSQSVVRETSEILAEARRAQRNKPSKDVSDTARAADDWIDFLDGRDPHARALSDSAVYKVADAFFKTQEKQNLNAARVPVNGRQTFSVHQSRPPPRGLAEEENVSPRFPPSPTFKLEIPREPASDRHRPPQFPRKRSASPPLTDHSSKSRRISYDVRQQHRAEPERHGALDELPTIQRTRSPQRSSHSRPTQPTAPAQPAQSAPTPSAPAKRAEVSNGASQSAQPTPCVTQSTIPPRAAQPIPTQPSLSAGRVQGPNVSTEGAVDDRSALKAYASIQAANDNAALKARIASLEKQLAETESKIRDAPAVLTATAPAPAPAGQQGEAAIDGLKKDMATATNAIATMMESMHDIVDSLNSLQDEISALSVQHKDLSTTLRQPSNGNSSNNQNLDSLLQPLQTLTKAVATLQTEVSSLKDRTPSPTPTPNNHALETLLHAQNARMDKLFRELASMQASLPSQAGAGAQQHQQQQPPPPQTLRQAMAAAERDLRHHLAAVQTFYHRGGASRAVTEQTADLLAMLSEGVRAAQAGMHGV